MSKLRDQVLAFHQKFNQPIASIPKVPDEAMVRFRLKLIAEEFFELLEAAGYHIHAAERGSVEVGDLCRNKFQRDVDLPSFVDALADLDYVVEGTRLVFGVHGGPIADEVQRANLSKDAVYVEAKAEHHKNATTKPTKPPGWTPPDIAGILRSQGWHSGCRYCGNPECHEGCRT